MDVDLLINPKLAGTADVDMVDIPTLNFEDVPVMNVMSSEPAAPRLVPSLEETGPIKLDGLDNFNAEPYIPAAPNRMS